MVGSAFSCPSTTLVCKAVYSSPIGTVAGEAPRPLNSEVEFGLAGTRIFMPSMSLGEMIGLLACVICRNPWSNALPTSTIPILSNWLRMCAPSSPSIAFQTVG